MRVLLTGAFGNIGSSTLRALLDAGHEVRGFDLKKTRSEKVAQTFDGGVDVFWGDVGNEADVRQAVEGCDAVIHNAAVLPPASEDFPELTHRINVEGTSALVAACEAQPTKPKFVFASSISLFGCTQHKEPPCRVGDPTEVSDHYTRSKTACEEMLQKSTLPWAILRFTATPPFKPSAMGKSGLAHFFDICPKTRMEFLHPSDAGLAQTNALSAEEAIGRILLIGGGAKCRMEMGELNNLYLEAAGIGAFPDSAFGTDPYYIDWIDSEESEEVLSYQRHGFEEFAAEIMRSMRWQRMLARPLRPLIRALMLRESPYYKAASKS